MQSSSNYGLNALSKNNQPLFLKKQNQNQNQNKKQQQQNKQTNKQKNKTKQNL